MQSAFVLLCVPLLVSAAGLLGSNQPCWEETRQLDARKEAEGGVLPPGASYPDCDRLGRYSPQQCTGSQCYCVDPSGEQLTKEDNVGYMVNIWEQDTQACRCVREKFDIERSGNVGVSVRCDEKGDYHHTQCHGSSCYCVRTHSGDKLEGERLEGHIAKYAELETRCAAVKQQ